KGMAMSCVSKIGKKETDIPRVRKCLDDGPQFAVEGAYTVRDKGKLGKTVYFDIQSNRFNAAQFADLDIDAFSERTAKRLCLDPDVSAGIKIGLKFHYDFYGADNAKVSSFMVTKNSCTKSHK
ncbi:MAG: hypothetical protein J0653_01120, partial [Deltaproteobacteria bacterium]|nr:hypothetical protein [Deltaproteobacteria bacterium]